MKSIIGAIVLIIAGLSGQFVLRGTDSSQALLIAGIIYLLFAVIRLVYKSKKEAGAQNTAYSNIGPTKGNTQSTNRFCPKCDLKITPNLNRCQNCGYILNNNPTLFRPNDAVISPNSVDGIPENNLKNCPKCGCSNKKTASNCRDCGEYI